MKYSAKEYAVVLYQVISETAQGDHDRILENFTKLLRDNNDLINYPDIEREFYAYEREVKGIKQAEIVSARPISDKEEREIIERLNIYAGSKVELKKKIDEDLVGGVVIRLGDELIDGSIKKHIKELKDQLKK